MVRGDHAIVDVLHPGESDAVYYDRYTGDRLEKRSLTGTPMIRDSITGERREYTPPPKPRKVRK